MTNLPTDKLRIGANADARRKVTPALKATIEKMYAEGHSQRAISRKTGLDRRTIKWQLGIDDYEAYNKNRYKEKPWLKYYNKDKHREYMRKHRAKLKAIGKPKDND